MEILTYKKVYQLVGDNSSGTNECITKSAAVEIAQAHRKNITSNLSQYLSNEYIDVFAVEDKPDLSAFSFANNRYNPQASGNTYTTSVSSRDIDGNTIPYNATADVDWITDIVIAGTEIRFKVNANIGDQRIGHITGSNATGKSDTITIVQEAKEADIDYTYTLVATCDSVPTVTINGTSITRYTTSGNEYTFQYTVRVRTENEAPQSVDFTIDGGGVGESYDDGILSVSPTSWDLNNGLSKQFTVSYSRVKTTKTWSRSTGTISRDSSVNVQLDASYDTEYPTIDYTITDQHSSGQSFSYSKGVMSFTAAASSVGCTGSIFVQYNGLSATIDVIYNKPAEEFPDDAEHRWIEVSPTSHSFSAEGGSVSITGSYGLTGSYGTRKKIGDISDTLTVDANTSTSSRSGSKTYYYNNDSSQTPTAEVSWTQEGREEAFRYEYHIYIGKNADNINQPLVSLVWQSDQYNESSKKTIFVKAYKDKINEQNQVVSTEQVEYGVKKTDANNSFNIINNTTGQIECYPSNENSSYYNSRINGLKIYIIEEQRKSCSVILVQDRKGVQIVSGDAVMFTYNWNKGTDLDQATFVNLNLPSDNNKNYAGFGGQIIPEYENILYFAGDNRGTGNEYAFIDFKNIAKYIDEYRNGPSSIPGKTILESLTDDNGVISVSCDLYTNWYAQKEQENITLSYSVYNKDSEDASVKAENLAFVLTGYTKIKDSSDQALCYAKGPQNYSDGDSVKETYTNSAKFTYYLNSGVFAFETNKDSIEKWNKGVEWNAGNAVPSCSSARLMINGQNIEFSAGLESVHQPDDFSETSDIKFVFYLNPATGAHQSIYSKQFSTKINELPYRFKASVPLQDVSNKIDFGENDSMEIYPSIESVHIKDYYNNKALFINGIQFKENVLTIQKPST